MRVLASVAAVVLAVAVTGSAAQAETRQQPAELPPASYSGNQYIDSEGCVFLRAEFAGKTSWVARLGRDRKPVCGYDPTVVASAPPAAAPAPVAPEPAAAPAAAKAPEPAVKTVAAPKPPKAKAAPVARKPARAAEPGPLALVATKRVGRTATYCPGRGNDAQRYLLSDGKRVTRCASDDGEAVAFINGLDVPGVVVSGRAPTAGEAGRAAAAERGEYRVTWVRGDLSPEGEAVFASAAGGGVIVGDGASPAPIAAAPAAVGAGSFVQIGAFADPANAERALQTLGRLGLPASVGLGGGLKVVLAGPFGSAAELSNAMALVRQNGYRDAFPTRG